MFSHPASGIVERETRSEQLAVVRAGLDQAETGMSILAGTVGREVGRTVEHGRERSRGRRVVAVATAAAVEGLGACVGIAIDAMTGEVP